MPGTDWDRIQEIFFQAAALLPTHAYRKLTVLWKGEGLLANQHIGKFFCQGGSLRTGKITVFGTNNQ